MRQGAVRVVGIAGVVGVVGALMVGGTAWAQPLTRRPVEGMPSPNASVNDLVMDGSTLYIAGGFSRVGTPAPAFRLVHPTTGEVVGRVPSIERPVYACVPDGSGGFYVGGELYVPEWGGAYGGLFRFGPDGERRPCAPLGISSGGLVYVMAVEGGTLFAGGRMEDGANFNLSALNLATGQLRGFNLSTNGFVTGLAGSDGVMYVCGEFTRIGGVTRPGAAAVRVSDGAILPWTPALDVSTGRYPGAIAVQGASVYIGGAGLIAGGTAKNLVRASAADGSLLPWSAATDNGVTKLVATPNAVYAAGGFARANGQDRERLAAWHPETGALLPWRPVPTTTNLESLSVGPGAVYIAASGLTAMGGQPRRGVAAVDPTTGAVLPWNPGGDGGVIDSYSAHFLGDRVAMHDGASLVGASTRELLAAVDVPTRTLLPLSAQFRVNGFESIYQMTKGGDRLIVQGSFRRVNGVATAGFGAVHASTGAWEGMDGIAGIGTPYVFAARGDRLYVMSEGGSLPSYSLSAIDLTTRTRVWNVPFAAGVTQVVVSEDGTLLGLNNLGSGRVRVLDAATGAERWSLPDPQRNVKDLAMHCDKLLIATPGTITANGRTSTGLAVASLADGRLIAPSPRMTYTPGGPSEFRVVGSGPAALLFGSFEAVNGVPVRYAAGIDLRSAATTTDWRPHGFWASRFASGSAGVAGGFSGVSTIEGVVCPNLAVFAARCDVDVNDDGFIDCFDYIDFVACFETGACSSGKSADFNGDGFADFFDYADFVAAFEAGC